MKTKTVITVLLLMIALPLYAGIVKEQGIGQIEYKGWGTPGKEQKRKAIQEAKINALTRYVAKSHQAQAMNYEKIKSKVEADIDTYVTDYTIVDEMVDKSAKILKIVIQATINTSLIDVELQKVSAVYESSDDEKSYMSFVFVAREAKAVKQFDAKRTQRVVDEAYVDEMESSLSEDGELEYSSTTKKDRARTSGGSSLQKADEIRYDVSNANEINTAMSNIFSTAGFEIVDAEYLTDETDGLVDVEMFISDYQYGDDISSQTRSDAVKGCKMVDVMYFAIGTLDVGMKDKDPVSGLTRVFVSVTGKVLSLKQRFPKTVASIGPVQFSGLGPDQTVARRNALTLSAEKAAKELVAQMRAKGIK